MGTLICSIVSRSRIVTWESSSVSKSTVTQKGVPIFVLPAIAASDALGVVELGGHVLAEQSVDVSSRGDQLFVSAERK